MQLTQGALGMLLGATLLDGTALADDFDVPTGAENTIKVHRPCAAGFLRTTHSQRSQPQGRAESLHPVRVFRVMFNQLL